MYTVAVITGTRAEYGLLRPVLRKLQASHLLRPLVYVTGAHLSDEFGHTVDEIEADGFEIAARVDILSQPAPSGRAGTAFRTQECLAAFLRLFEVAPPAAALCLGDRYEMLAAGQAAALLGIPVIHISGGDVTEGADDDWFRHCLTKMAKLHFPSCEAYRHRLILMGEQPGRVYNVGGLGDENIRSMRLLGRDELAGEFGGWVTGDYVLVTLHPETAGDVSPKRQADEVLKALEGFPKLFCLFTAANADAGGSEINRELEAFCDAHEKALLVKSLGSLRYLSFMKYACAVVGNSSSGVVETPSLGVPAVDIGRRQAGRVTGANVLHTRLEADEIAAALATALTEEFTGRAKMVQSPYNGGDTSVKIVSLMEAFITDGSLLRPKVFYDWEGKA